MAELEAAREAATNEEKEIIDETHEEGETATEAAKPILDAVVIPEKKEKG